MKSISLETPDDIKLTQVQRQDLYFTEGVLNTYTVNVKKEYSVK